jgi:hypothetical protein
MTIIDNDEVYNILINPKNTQTHWISDCPICGTSQHFYVRKRTNLVDGRGNNKSFNFDCKKCKEEGGIYTLLKAFGKLDLYDLKKNVGDTLDLNFTSSEYEEFDMSEPRTILNPIGFRRIYSDGYLQSRGFKEIDFYRYEIGYTALKKKLSDYVVIMIQQNFKNKAYVARCVLDKKIVESRKLLRYINSKNDFAKLLFGYDEVVKNKTKEVKLVEGLFDKNSVDHALDLVSSPKIKCLCTFGSKLSEYQMRLLAAKGVENITIAFDKDAFIAVKKYSQLAKKLFKSVNIAFTNNKDFNDSSDKEIIEVFERKNLDANYFSDNFVALPKFN